MESTQATHSDADLALRLYDLRREAEMRRARNWFSGEFWPRSFSEVEQLVTQYGSLQNGWFRQVLSYWDMAAAFVLRGTLHPGLFHDTCGEAWFCYAKVKPFVQEARAKFNSPEFAANLEKVIEGSAEGRERLQRMQENIRQFSAMVEENRKQRPVSSSEAA
jgi:hypothetical protein